MNEPDTLVLGAGSALMGDDGLGVLVVHELEGRGVEGEGLAILDGGTWGMRVLPFIEMADRLLIVDAMKTGAPPGTVVRLDGDAVPRHLRQKISPHQIELGEVLAVAQLRDHLPSEIVALGIEPASIELREGLSPEVEAAVPALVEAVEEQLGTWGYALRPREVGADA